MHSIDGLDKPWTACPMPGNWGLSLSAGDTKPGESPQEMSSDPCMAPPESNDEAAAPGVEHWYYDEHMDIRR
jgi:hypothetical protein